MLPRVDISSQLRPFRGSEQFQENEKPRHFLHIDCVWRKGVPEPASNMRWNEISCKRVHHEKMQELGAPEPPLPLLRSLSSFLFWISSLNTRTMLTNFPRADKGLLLLLPPCEVLGDASSGIGVRPGHPKARSKGHIQRKAEKTQMWIEKRICRWKNDAKINSKTKHKCKSPWERGNAWGDESNCDPASAAIAPLLQIKLKKADWNQKKTLRAA